MDRQDLTKYIAGFFDGEGSVLIRKNRDKRRKNIQYQIAVTITNTNWGILELCKTLYGGSVIKKNKENTIWAWRSVSIQAYKFLNEITPYLLIKKEEAKLALDFQENIINKSNLLSKKDLIDREEYFKNMKKLRGTL